MRDEVDKHIDEMLQKKVIEPADGPRSSGIVLVKKKDGSTRFCVDYRRLNDLTTKDAYPLPRNPKLKESSWSSECGLRAIFAFHFYLPIS
jgi:hypothetical protein